MIQFHSIEVKGQIWSMRCAVLSMECATKTVLSRLSSSVCAVRQMCFLGCLYLKGV